MFKFSIEYMKICAFIFKLSIILCIYLLLTSLFVVFRPIREFFNHLETSPLTVKGCQFWRMISTYGHGTLRVLCVPHLLWHGASVYYGHLRGPVTLTPNAERLAVELSLHVLTTWVCRCWDSNTQPSACGSNALTNCATIAALTSF